MMNVRSQISWDRVLYPLSFLSAGGVGHLYGWEYALWGFIVAMYGLYAVRLCMRFVQGIRKENAAEYQATILNDDEPSLPLTAMGLAFGSAYLLWVTGYLPVLPSVLSAWQWWHAPLAFVGFFVWFMLVTIVVMFSVFTVGEAVRRALGKEPLPW